MRLPLPSLMQYNFLVKLKKIIAAVNCSLVQAETWNEARFPTGLNVILLTYVFSSDGSTVLWIHPFFNGHQYSDSGGSQVTILKKNGGAAKQDVDDKYALFASVERSVSHCVILLYLYDRSQLYFQAIHRKLRNALRRHARISFSLLNTKGSVERKTTHCRCHRILTVKLGLGFIS